jgi:hypothetical protein
VCMLFWDITEESILTESGFTFHPGLDVKE